jgi:hypothetical protein
MSISKKLKRQLGDLALAPFGRFERRERDRRVQEKIKRFEDKAQIGKQFEADS